MQTELPSFITPDAQAGLSLAGRLADQLHTQLEEANAKIEQPGGINYLMPPAAPKEVPASILFYTIAAVNRGWPAKT